MTALDYLSAQFSYSTLLEKAEATGQLYVYTEEAFCSKLVDMLLAVQDSLEVFHQAPADNMLVGSDAWSLIRRYTWGDTFKAYNDLTELHQGNMGRCLGINMWSDAYMFERDRFIPSNEIMMLCGPVDHIGAAVIRIVK